MALVIMALSTLSQKADEIVQDLKDGHEVVAFRKGRPVFKLVLCEDKIKRVGRSTEPSGFDSTPKLKVATSNKNVDDPSDDIAKAIEKVTNPSGYEAFRRQSMYIFGEEFDEDKCKAAYKSRN
jgi:antitoxin (DNA-binding transcriptional repressor) of toxin-antitoxin stability system